MLALRKTSWLPKLPSLDGVKHFFYGLAPNYFRTDGIGAHKRFVDEALTVCRLFIKSSGTRLGTDEHAFICRLCARRHRPSVVASVECRRVVLDRSINGKVIGRMRWIIPVCDTCDHELPLDVTDPILIDRGRKLEGYIDIPDEILLFFDAEIEDAS